MPKTLPSCASAFEYSQRFYPSGNSNLFIICVVVICLLISQSYLHPVGLTMCISLNAYLTTNIANA